MGGVFWEFFFLDCNWCRRKAALSGIFLSFCAVLISEMVCGGLLAYIFLNIEFAVVPLYGFGSFSCGFRFLSAYPKRVRFSKALADLSPTPCYHQCFFIILCVFLFLNCGTLDSCLVFLERVLWKKGTGLPSSSGFSPNATPIVRSHGDLKGIWAYVLFFFFVCFF